MSLKTFKATGAGAMAETLTLVENFKLVSVSLHLDIAGGAVEDFEMNVDDGVGAAYDVNVITEDTLTLLDLVFAPEGDLFYLKGDKLIFTYTNTNARTWGLSVKYRPNLS